MVFETMPVQAAWQLKPAKRVWLVDVLRLFLAVGVFNLLTDLILVLLPVPVVLRLHTTRKKKGMKTPFQILLGIIIKPPPSSSLLSLRQ